VPHRSHWLAAILFLVLLALAVVVLVRFDVFGGSSASNGEEGSGIAATDKREVAPFETVELAGSNNVTIRVSEDQAVAVHADHNLLDRVTTEVQSGNLVIGNVSGSFTAKSPMHVDVSVPSLSEVTLSGSGNIAVSGIDGNRLTIILSGSGVVIGSGNIEHLDVALSGSGDAQLGQLTANGVRALVSGSGNVFVTATESLDASVPGSGVIIYAGDPKEVTKSITGSGTIVGK
jgi:hypothetical protein